MTSLLRVRVLLATTLMGGAAAVLMAPGAHALSCVGPETVIKDAPMVFAGTVVDTDGDRVLVQVEQNFGPTKADAQEWLTLDLVDWWSQESPADSTATWLFAPTQGKVNPCSAWTEGGEYGYPAGYELGAPAGVLIEDPSAPPSPPSDVPTEGTVIPNEPWNAEKNPAMADLARKAEAAAAAEPRHSAATLSLWAVGGVALGAAALGGLAVTGRLPGVRGRQRS